MLRSIHKPVNIAMTLNLRSLAGMKTDRDRNYKVIQQVIEPELPAGVHSSELMLTELTEDEFNS